MAEPTTSTLQSELYQRETRCTKEVHNDPVRESRFAHNPCSLQRYAMIQSPTFAPNDRQHTTPPYLQSPPPDLQFSSSVPQPSRPPSQVLYSDPDSPYVRAPQLSDQRAPPS